jgi:hypothetical protein
VEKYIVFLEIQKYKYLTKILVYNSYTLSDPEINFGIFKLKIKVSNKGLSGALCIFAAFIF